MTPTTISSCQRCSRPISPAALQPHNVWPRLCSLACEQAWALAHAPRTRPSRHRGGRASRAKHEARLAQLVTAARAAGQATKRA